MALAPPLGSTGSLPQILRRLRIGAGLTVAGIALCVIDVPSIGGLTAVAGVSLVVWNLHRLGRTGPS